MALLERDGELEALETALRQAQRERGQPVLIEGPAGLGKTSLPSMLHGLYWLLNNLAREAPVALAVDDLHGCDGESLRFFNYLAPRLDGIPLALLGTARESISAGAPRAAIQPGRKRR